MTLLTAPTCSSRVEAQKSQPYSEIMKLSKRILPGPSLTFLLLFPMATTSVPLPFDFLAQFKVKHPGSRFHFCKTNHLRMQQLKRTVHICYFTSFLSAEPGGWTEHSLWKAPWGEKVCLHGGPLAQQASWCRLSVGGLGSHPRAAGTSL